MESIEKLNLFYKARATTLAARQPGRRAIVPARSRQGDNVINTTRVMGCAAAFAAAASVQAYDVVPVTGGGKVEGKVTFQGPVPMRKVIPTKDKDVCGGPRDDPQVRVG